MFAFRSNYGRIFSRFGTICERDTPSLTPHDIEPRDAASLDCSRAVESEEDQPGADTAVALARTLPRVTWCIPLVDGPRLGPAVPRVPSSVASFPAHDAAAPAAHAVLHTGQTARNTVQLGLLLNGVKLGQVT